MYILSIDTSCDETSVAVTQQRCVRAHVEYTQAVVHAKWGGVVPSLAKRAHKERIDSVIERTLQKAKMDMEKIDALAVTVGPGLAIALEVGIRTAKNLSLQYNKPLIPVNHMEGHIYSCFVQNTKGNPVRPFSFPYLAILASGGHTELVHFSDHLCYTILGSTRDDAVGESLDKAARMLGFGYPGGPVIERLAEEVENKDYFQFPRPMLRSTDLDFSYAGLKTALMYFLRRMPETERSQKVREIASSYQEAAFGALVRKTQRAIQQTGVSSLLLGGGVAANKRLRTLLRTLARTHKGTIFFPPYKYLNADNAAMIGVVAYYKALQGLHSQNVEHINRVPRLALS